MGIYTHYLDWLLPVTPSSQFFTITLFLFSTKSTTESASIDSGKAVWGEAVSLMFGVGCLYC
jgi:hypothetical protein